MSRSQKAMIFVVLASFALSFYFYPIFPDSIPSHWNINGQVDGYTSKAFGLMLFPFMTLLFLVLAIGIPRIDPYRKNVEKFRPQYEHFMLLITLFMFYLFLLTVWWTIGERFNMMQALSIPFALLFYYSGSLIEKSKRNWFIGIRTPWTMMNEAVWNRTSRVGGLLFKVCALITLLSVPFPGWAIFFIIVPVLFVTLYCVVYSYVEYGKETKGSKRKTARSSRKRK